MQQQTEPKAAETNAEATDGSGGVRQLLGLKGATEATGEEFLNWKIRLQLTKPATWVPLIWGVACGAAASGNYHAIWNLFGDAPTTGSAGVVFEDTIKAICAMILAGPFSARLHPAHHPSPAYALHSAACSDDAAMPLETILFVPRADPTLRRSRACLCRGRLCFLALSVAPRRRPQLMPTRVPSPCSVRLHADHQRLV